MIKLEANFNDKSTKLEANGKGFDLLIESGQVILSLVDMHMKHASVSMEEAEAMVAGAYKALKGSTEKIVSVDKAAFRKD